MPSTHQTYGAVLNGNGVSSRYDEEYRVPRTRIFADRWKMLLIFSFLTATNNGICFSFAPVTSIALQYFAIHCTFLVSVYFITYLPMSFVGSWMLDKYGLRWCIVSGALWQAIGAWIRFAACYWDGYHQAVILVVGQVIASLAQPMFVNSPGLLSRIWFPPRERPFATSAAVNANSLGIAVVYLVAPLVVVSFKDIPNWNLMLAMFSTGLFFIAICFFDSHPPLAPNAYDAVFRESRRSGESKSAIESEQLSESSDSIEDVPPTETYDWGSWIAACKSPGFFVTVFSFAVAELILNAVSTLLDMFLRPNNFSAHEVGFWGAVFVITALVGSSTVTYIKTEVKMFGKTICLCLLACAVCLLLFKYTLTIGSKFSAVIALLFLGYFVGPIQPLALELGVECVYPISEPTVAAVQQLFGNFLSAIFVPFMSELHLEFLNPYTGHVRGKDWWAVPELWMAFLSLLSISFFLGCFKSNYSRVKHEKEFANCINKKESL
eukprot:g4936.t1